jgi:hypothetical protein
MVSRAGVIVVLIASWLGVSNHCALAASIPEKPTQRTSECPFHSSPAKPQKQSPAQPCCKILRAILATPAKVPARLVVGVRNVDLGFVEFVVFAPPRICPNPNALDTGPPGAISFAELILQRSILSHAPPHCG